MHKTEFIMKSKIIPALAFTAAALNATAQDNQCAVEYSMYKEFVNVEAYSEAREPFWKVFKDCPKFSKNIYIDGSKIYRSMISKAGEDDDALVNAYVDTLGIIYRQRIANYGEPASVWSRYGMEIMKYRRSDTANLEGFHTIAKAIAANPTDPDIASVAAYTQAACALLANGTIDNEQAFDALEPVVKSVYRNRESKSESYGETADKVFSVMRRTFSQSSATPTFDELFQRKRTLPSSITEVAALTKTMDVFSADGNDLYAQCAERLYKNNPSAQAAASIARYNRHAKKYDNAAKYYDEAIKMETDQKLKSDYLYEAATVANNQNKHREAVALAKKSAAANPKNGAPSLLIAAIYMVNANNFGDDDFAHRTVYWVAADYASKAKTADMPLTEEANKLIDKCKKQFPKKEDAFMHSIKSGDAVTVKTYDTETTTARF